MYIGVPSKPFIRRYTKTTGPTMKMLKIKDETHKQLTKILGELTARNGSVKTYDDVLQELIRIYRKG